MVVLFLLELRTVIRIPMNLLCRTLLFFLLVSMFKKTDFDSLCRILQLVSWCRCIKSYLILFISNVFHPFSSGNDNKYVLMVRLSYSSNVYVFIALLVNVGVLAFRALTAGHRTSTIGDVLQLVWPRS